MSSRKTVLYAVALAGAVTLGLAGCNGGEDEPTKTATPTASASGSPSASASGSVTGSATPSPSVSVSVPAAARAHTEAGAVEFAKFFIQEADGSYVTWNTDVVSGLGGPACKACNVVVDGVAEMKAAGEKQLRPSFQVGATNVLPGGTKDAKDVQVLVNKTKTAIVNKAGTVVETLPAGKATWQVQVDWVGQGWRVTEFDAS